METTLSEENRLPLVGLTETELEALCEGLGQKKFRGRQLCQWLYQKKAPEFKYMTNLPAPFRERMAAAHDVRGSFVEQTQESADETVKALVRLQDGHSIELVLIPADERVTVCVSTQVGCAVQCAFCASGTGGLVRNLTAGEIVEEILHAHDLAYDLLGAARVDNIVFMGIGEPLMNYDNVLKAIRILNAPWGLEIGARRMTLSTIGLPEQIDRLAEEDLQITLAISLHAMDDETRDRLVPINKKVGVDVLLDAARRYFSKTGREVTFEIVLIDGINCTKRRALTMAKALKGIRCNVNLIPLNPNLFTDLKPPAPPDVDEFASTLRRWGVNVHVRRRRGRDIDAACGQLRMKSGLKKEEDGAEE